MVIHRCDECGYICDRRSSLIRHSAKHSDLRPFRCNLCPKRFNSNCALLLHTKEIHSSTFYKCGICDKEFVQKRTRDTHMLSHKNGDDVRIYRCQLCPYKGKLKHHLKRHMATMHGNDPPRTKTYEHLVSSMLTSLGAPFVREFFIKKT